MRTLFIYPNKCDHPKCFNVGVAMLAGMLKKHGYEYTLLDTTFGMTFDELVQKAVSYKPDLIAFTTVTNNYHNTVELAGMIKAVMPRVPTIVGGVHPTIDPEGTIANECIDMICVGEGQEAFLELVQSMGEGREDTGIKNLWFKKDGKIIKNELRPLVSDLDSLPLPDMEIYDYQLYLDNHNMIAPVIGSLGCPYQCTYCINKTLQNLYKGLGPYVRFRGVDNLIEEIKTLVKRYPAIKGIEFYDDTFTLKKKRVTEFCEKWRREVDLPFFINARIDNIDEKMCEELSKAGCVRMSLGLESGDPAIREEVLNRKIDNDVFVEKCRIIRKYGIGIYTYNMIGIPGETEEDIRKTIELNRRIQPDHLAVTIFNAFKGTQLYEKCEEKGMLIKEVQRNSYYVTSNVVHDKLSIERLKNIRKWFPYKVYKGKNTKKALMNTIDRSLLGLPFYTRFRSLAIMMLSDNFSKKSKG